MSQEKVDRYKQEKANRKKIMRKQKLQNTVRKIVISVAGLAVVGWIGYSAYHSYESSRPKEEVQIDYTAFSDLSQKISDVSEASE